MATTSKRNKPSRTPTAAVLIDAKHHNEAIKTLREISKRGARVSDQMVKTYDEVECIAQTVDALACKIGDGSMNSKQIIAALEKIESRLHSQACARHALRRERDSMKRSVSLKPAH